MLGTFSFSSVSSRARAAIGRLRGVVTGRKGTDDVSAIEIEAPVAGASLSQEGYEAKTVETEDDQKVTIFVATTPVYSDDMEELAPTVVGSAKQDDVEETPAVFVKMEKVVASEPADLFINALRRPVKEKFDTSAPFIKKKVATEVPVVEEMPVPAVEPVVENVVPVIETVEVEAPVAEEIEIVTITDDRTPVIEIASVDDVEAVEKVVVAEEVVVSAIEPVVEEAEAPVEVAEVSAVDEALIETLEADEAKVECEIAHGAEETVAAEQIIVPATVTPALPRKIEVPELEPVDAEVAAVESVENFETAKTSAEAIEAPVTNIDTVIIVQPEVKAMTIEDESDAILAFRSELSEDADLFISTSYDDNLAYREDYLDRTERTFKIRASSVRPRPRFDGNFRSLSRY